MDDLQRQQSFEFFKSMLVLMGIWLFSLMLAPLLLNPLLNLFGMNDYQLVLAEIKKGNFLENLNGLRIITGVLHGFVFLVPALIFIHFFLQKSVGQFTYTNRAPTLSSLGLALLIMLLAQPLAMSLFYLNNTLFESWINSEAQEQTKLLLQMNSPLDFLITFLLIGVMAGLGEELLLRGVVQRIFAQRFQNLHWGVWMAAILFSLIHFELNAFLPRLVLGALLGYLFWWSGNLWISIICHALYNGTQVALVYFSPEMINETAPESLNILYLGIALGCAVALVPLCRFFIRHHQTTNLLTTSYLISNFEHASSEDDTIL